MGRPCLHCERQPPPPGPLPHKEGGGDTTWRYAKYFAWAAALSRVCLQLAYVAAGDSHPSCRRYAAVVPTICIDRQRAIVR